MAVRHRLGDYRQKKRLGAEEGRSFGVLVPLAGMWDGADLEDSWNTASGGSVTPGSWPGRTKGVP